MNATQLNHIITTRNIPAGTWIPGANISVITFTMAGNVWPVWDSTQIKFNDTQELVEVRHGSVERIGESLKGTVSGITTSTITMSQEVETLYYEASTAFLPNRPNIIPAVGDKLLLIKDASNAGYTRGSVSANITGIDVQAGTIDIDADLTLSIAAGDTVAVVKAGKTYDINYDTTGDEWDVVYDTGIMFNFIPHRADELAEEFYDYTDVNGFQFNSKNSVHGSVGINTSAMGINKKINR